LSRLPSPLRLGHRLLLEFRRPSTTSTIKPPLLSGRDCPPNRGSALRISHPFSGFREIVFHRFISPGNRSWTVSLLSVPPVRVGGAFRHPIACSHAVIHQRAKARPSSLITPGFHPPPRLSAEAWLPPRAMSSLFIGPKPYFPVTLDHQQRNHFLPQASPAPKRLSPHRSVRVLSEQARTKRPILTWVLSSPPATSPPNLGPSNPPPPLDAGTEPRPEPLLG